MTATQREIAELEERLRQAELQPDPAFFEEVVSDDVVLASQNGPVSFGKAALLRLHRRDVAPRFTRIENGSLTIVDHGGAAVVTCRRIYEGRSFTGTLAFVRLWVKKRDGWRIVASAMCD